MREPRNVFARYWRTDLRQQGTDRQTCVSKVLTDRLVLQSVIGKEARQQMLDQWGKLPDAIIACVGGGSNAIGLFHPFVNDKVRHIVLWMYVWERQCVFSTMWIKLHFVGSCCCSLFFVSKVTSESIWGSGFPDFKRVLLLMLSLSLSLSLFEGACVEFGEKRESYRVKLCMHVDSAWLDTLLTV